jgi:hypothetical protein
MEQGSDIASTPDCDNSLANFFAIRRLCLKEQSQPLSLQWMGARWETEHRGVSLAGALAPLPVNSSLLLDVLKPGAIE